MTGAGRHVVGDACPFRKPLLNPSFNMSEETHFLGTELVVRTSRINGHASTARLIT